METEKNRFKHKFLKKNILLILLSVLIVFISIIYIWQPLGLSKNSRTQNNTSKTINLNEKNDEQIIQASVNDTLIITLNNPGDGGYKFDEPIYDNDILKKNIFRHINPNNSMPGNFGQDQWVFSALREGRTKLSYEIYRPWESSNKIKRFEILININ